MTRFPFHSVIMTSFRIGMFSLLLSNTILTIPTCQAFTLPSNRGIINGVQRCCAKSCTRQSVALRARGTDDDEVFDWNPSDPQDGDPEIIFRGDDADEIDGAVWEDLETGEPPKLLVMKQLLGINIFTYILGALIIFFLSMNYFIGPGWLGSAIGVPGTGAINEVSESFPDTVDLSSPEFRL